MAQTIKTSINEQVGTISLDHNKENTLTIQLLNEMHEAFMQFDADESVGAILLQSESDSFFSNGFDIPELTNTDHYSGRMDTHFPMLFKILKQIYSIKKPTVVCINAHAIAGGAVLILPFDFKVVADGARCAFPEINLGLPIPQIMINIMVQSIGFTNAKRLALLGRAIKSDEALKIGLVDYIYSKAEVKEKSFFLAKKLAKSNPKVYRAIKANLQNNLLDNIDESSITEEFVQLGFGQEEFELTKARLNKILGGVST